MNRNKRGMMLVEVITYIFVVSIILFFAGKGILEYRRSTAKTLKTIYDIKKVLRIGEQWRDDIRKSQKEPIFTKETLLLVHKEENLSYTFHKKRIRKSQSTIKKMLATKQYRTLYFWELKIEKSSGTVNYLFKDGVLKRKFNHEWEILLKNVKTSSIVKDHYTKVNAWRFELELITRSSKTKVRPLFTFKAVRRQK